MAWFNQHLYGGGTIKLNLGVAKRLRLKRFPPKLKCADVDTAGEESDSEGFQSDILLTCYSASTDAESAHKQVVVKKNKWLGVPWNKEGAVVGFEATRLAEENMGYRVSISDQFANLTSLLTLLLDPTQLLVDMGWEAGMGIGASPGLTEPVGAVIKLSKNGVGFLSAWQKLQKLRKAAVEAQRKDDESD